MTADLVLRGGMVHDGLGSPPLRADVVIDGGRIAAIDTHRHSAREVIDCDGLLVAPGFIDPHSHSDLVHLAAEPAPFKLAQGVTTEVVGNCGFSFAPMTAAALDLLGATWSELSAGQEMRPRSFAEYLAELEQARPSNNVAALVGHGTLRAVSNGVEPDLRPGALEQMRALTGEALAAGAAGVSSGLIYVPGSYSDTDELVAVAEIAAAHGRPYTTHMRDEADHLAGSLDEAVAIGRRSGARVQVSHCKVAGRRNHGNAAMLRARLAAARRDGVDLYGDQYPYTAGSTLLAALLPPISQRGGVDALRERLASAERRAELRGIAESGVGGSGLWGQVLPGDVRVVRHGDARVIGRTLDEISGDDHAWDVLCALVRDDPSSLIVVELMAEDDVQAIMRDPLVAVGSDNGPPVGLQHPRTWGCFPRVLGRYVLELGVLTWEEAIRKMTSVAAQQFRLAGRGALLPGMVADVCAVDPRRIGHDGSALQPDVRPTGVELVLLAGTAVLRGGSPTGARHGQVLRPAAAWDGAAAR